MKYMDHATIIHTNFATEKSILVKSVKFFSAGSTQITIQRFTEQETTYTKRYQFFHFSEKSHKTAKSIGVCYEQDYYPLLANR